MSAKFDEVCVNEIQRLRLREWKCCEIAAELDCSESTVHKYALPVAAGGFKFSHRLGSEPLTEYQHREIVRMAAYGMNYSEIARRIGCSSSTVSKHVKRGKRDEIFMRRALGYCN